MYDSIIIGAGPAGLTSAIYLLRANKKVLIIEKEGIGGQIASSPLIENYPGFSKISGSEFANNLFEQVSNLGGDFAIEEVLEITKDKKVITDSSTYEAKTIIIATGCKHRRLNLDSEEELIGNGIHFCVSCDGAFYKDKIVAVVGGGNSAVINAISLSELCKKVYVIQLLDHLTAEDKLISTLEKLDNVEIKLNSSVKEYLKEDELKGIKILSNDKEEIINVDGIFLSIGLIPNSKIFESIIDINDYGYIISENTFTKEKGIFVAGDVREKEIRQLTTATNDGTIAAIKAIEYLKEMK